MLSTGETVLTEGPARFHPIAGRTFPEWIEPRVPGRVGHPGQFRFESSFESTVHTGTGIETRIGSTLHELVALA